MPKQRKDFKERLSIMVTEGTAAELIAMAYLRHLSGSYALLSRSYIEAGLEQAKKSMSPKEKKEFEEILANVKTRLKLEAEERRSRIHKGGRRQGAEQKSAGSERV